MHESTRIGITREYRPENGELPDGVRPLLDAGCVVEWLPAEREFADARLIDQYDAIIASSLPYRSASFDGLRRLRLIARFGVGYDAIDLAAATRAGVGVTVTRGAAGRPVAEAALAMLLALSHHLIPKDAQIRSGRWAERAFTPGFELRDRVVGIIGFGSIGQEFAQLLSGFGVREILVCDPQADTGAVMRAGARVVSLDDLMSRADVVSIHCALTPATRGLIGRSQLKLLSPQAVIVNTSRGPVIDEGALIELLTAGAIRGAALDVFEQEPLPADHPLARLPNTVLSPHAACLTEELYRDYYQSICKSVLSALAGEPPEHLLNREVIGHPRWKQAAPSERG